jgi:hypothetical protein
MREAGLRRARKLIRDHHPTQQAGIDDGSMSRLAERHPAIARIPAAAYRAIHRWCAAHDVERGSTYYHERDDGLSQGSVLEATVRALSEGRAPRGVDDPTGLSGSEDILPAKTCLVVWKPGCELGYPGHHRRYPARGWAYNR